MQVQHKLQQLDALLRESKLKEADAFLTEQIQAAKQEPDWEAALTLYNEQMGFLRDCGRFAESITAGEQALQCIQTLHLEQTLPHATTLLNVANAQRAAGKYESAFSSYRAVKELYDRLLSPTDDRMASYYNNLSLLYQAVEDWEASCTALEQALQIVTQQKDQTTRVAISQTNLAVSLLHLHRVDRALPLLQAALNVFRGLSPSDFHYSATLAAMGDAQFQLQNYKTAVWYYEAALSEMELHMGRGAAYEIVQENAAHAYEKLGGKPVRNGMTLCKQYYETFGKPMLQRMFPDVWNQLAVGLVGEGSECFGYDDALSQDHDFGPGFCIWVPDTMNKTQITALQHAYALLPKTYCGITRTVTPQGTERVGVCRISDFYRRLIGIDGIPQTEAQWLQIEEEQLAAAVNGTVFQDNLGAFTRIRKALQFGYPKAVHLRRLAQETAWMAQRGQYNLPRLLQRGDKLTAILAFSHFAESAMRAAHLCAGVYAPYYKWLLHSTEQLPQGEAIAARLKLWETLPIEQWENEIITPVCQILADQMRLQGITERKDNYMQVHAEAAAAQATALEQQETLVQQIVKLEFSEFDKVKNEGVRAGCQDDWETFSIMRKSQYLTWPLAMLQQYWLELQSSSQQGWNLLTEKYARMMESTAPKEYASLQKELPPVSEQKKALCEAIVAIQVSWMEDFAKQYPKLAGQARNIHTTEDTAWNTSYETYLRGELLTYSKTLLQQYGAWIVQLHRNGKNLAEMTMANTAAFYRYTSLEEAEAHADTLSSD
ncbi:MAG: DUF4125 family protein [Oscillospiraceae bacterium]|nr:DUF4125 family protein [Oscillospiraceae bacterium]